MRKFKPGLIGPFLALMLAPGVLAAETVQAALQRGDAAAARAALEPEIAGRRDAGLHRAYLEGLIAMRQGDDAKAAEIFRAILQVAPGFEPAKLQLVLALDRLGLRSKAISHAKDLAATTEDARLRDRLLAQIATADSRAGRSGGTAFRFSLLPSTNITGGSSASTVIIGGVPFTLDPASRKASGVGVSFGVTRWKTWNIGAGWRAALSASADARVYATALKPDEAELGLRLDLSRLGARGAVSFGPRLGVLFQGKDRARQQAGIGFSADYLLNPHLRLTYSAEWMSQRFPAAPYRDGSRASATMGLQWAPSKTTVFSVDLPALRETAKADHLSHRDLALGVGVYTRLRGGMNVGASILAGQNRYDGTYPGFSIARKDDVASLRLSLSHPDISWKGLTPEFSITRKRQSSNIPLHDTWSTDFGLSLAKRF